MTRPDHTIFVPGDGIGTEMLGATFGTSAATWGRTGRCGGTTPAELA